MHHAVFKRDIVDHENVPINDFLSHPAPYWLKGF